MKNNKIALLPGLSLFLCFCLLSGTGYLVDRFGVSTLSVFLAETASYILPMFLVVSAMRDQKPLNRRLRPAKLPKGAKGLAVLLGISVGMLSLSLTLLAHQIGGFAKAQLMVTALDSAQAGLTLGGKLFVTVFVSAVVEEFYLRGALMTMQEQSVGTGACLVFSGFAFAVLHASPMHFVGPFLAGMVYAYLTYVFGSVWPAILAHAVNNLYYIGVLWLTNTYAAFGIWNHFAAVNAIVMLVFMYFTLQKVENMLLRGSLPHMERGAGLYDILLLMRNPGVVIFIVAFFVRIVLRLI